MPIAVTHEPDLQAVRWKYTADSPASNPSPVSFPSGIVRRTLLVYHFNRRTEDPTHLSPPSEYAYEEITHAPGLPLLHSSRKLGSWLEIQKVCGHTPKDGLGTGFTLLWYQETLAREKQENSLDLKSWSSSKMLTNTWACYQGDPAGREHVPQFAIIASNGIILCFARSSLETTSRGWGRLKALARTLFASSAVECVCSRLCDSLRVFFNSKSRRRSCWVGWRKMLPRLLTAVLAALVCGGEGGQVIGSSVHGSRPTEGSVGVGSAVASSTTDSGKIVRDRRGRCYGGSLSARALCVRARGGSLAEVSGLDCALYQLSVLVTMWVACVVNCRVGALHVQDGSMCITHQHDSRVAVRLRVYVSFGMFSCFHACRSIRSISILINHDLGAAEEKRPAVRVHAHVCAVTRSMWTQFRRQLPRMIGTWTLVLLFCGTRTWQWSSVRKPKHCRYLFLLMTTVCFCSFRCFLRHVHQGQGPTDYLSTLQDQSQPWWIDGKKNAVSLRKTAWLRVVCPPALVYVNYNYRRRENVGWEGMGWAMHRSKPVGAWLVWVGTRIESALIGYSRVENHSSVAPFVDNRIRRLNSVIGWAIAIQFSFPVFLATKKRKPAGSGGALFAADKNKQRRRGKTTARGFGSTSRASTSAPATSFRTGSLATGDEPLRSVSREYDRFCFE